MMSEKDEHFALAPVADDFDFNPCVWAEAVLHLGGGGLDFRGGFARQAFGVHCCLPQSQYLSYLC